MLPLGCPWAASDLIGQRIGTRERTATGQGRDRDGTGTRDRDGTGTRDRDGTGTGQEGVKKKRD